MNAKTRKQINQLTGQLENIKAQFEEMQSEEEQKYNNLPEGLQQGEAGQCMEAAASSLTDAVESLDAALSSIYDIQ